MQKIWHLLENPPQSFFESHPELPPLVASLLYHRGIETQEQIDEFLNPDYLQDVHDPYLFRDMEKAVERIYKAIDNGEKIIVHGDYDADGVCGAIIIISALKALGAQNVNVFLPHREIDGYGLNKNTVQKFADEKINLVITCDCGASNYEEVAMANEKEIDVIITDHHSVPETVPPAYAIIHPKIKNETYPDKGLAGGGVAFKLAQGLLKKNPRGKPALGWEKWLLDLVAIATVADMVPLMGESRTLTKYGLVVLNKTKRIGLQKLLLEARLLQADGTSKYNLTADTIGFQIAPRLNAAGRMNHANTAYNLLNTENPQEAAELAHELDLNNQERQKTTENLVKEAVEEIEKKQKDEPVLIYFNQDWPPGIIGLVSGKIKDKFYKPTIIITESEKEIVGSGRSINEFNLIQALQEMPELFHKFGGHPMACGFTLKSKIQIEEFRNKLKEKFMEKTQGMDLNPVLKIDAEVDLDEVNWELYNLLEKFEPFGEHNEKPKYLASGLEIAGLEPVGKDGRHLRIMVKHNSEKIRKTIGWDLCNENNCHCTDWSKALKIGDKIDMVFEIDVNQWNGNRELQLTILDLRACNTNTLINANDANHANNIIEDENGIIYKELSYAINGVLFKVHNNLGRYCNEQQIGDAIESELKNEKIPYEREKLIPPSFTGERFGRNKVDFIINDKIILENKVRRFIGKEEYYQCLRYLEAFDKKLCILVNFRDKQLKIKRIINPKAKI